MHRIIHSMIHSTLYYNIQKFISSHVVIRRNTHRDSVCQNSQFTIVSFACLVYKQIRTLTPLFCIYLDSRPLSEQATLFQWLLIAVQCMKTILLASSRNRVMEFAFKSEQILIESIDSIKLFEISSKNLGFRPSVEREA